MDSKNIFKLGLILLIICAVSTALLAWVNEVTSPVIEENTLKAQELAKKEVLPLAESFEEVGNGVYKGLKGSDHIGYAVDVTANGYGGAIEMTVGINKDMTVSGVKILSMSETPGLGAKAQSEDFLNQFKGKTEAFELKKSQAGENEITAITGATVTSSAVTNGVKEAFKLLANEGGSK